MISTSKSTLSLNNLKILRPKFTKILWICLRCFVNPHSVFLTIKQRSRCSKNIKQLSSIGLEFQLFFTPCLNFINILCTLFCQYPFAKNSQCQTVIRERLHNLLTYKKLARKMLMKLTPCFNPKQGPLQVILHLKLFWTFLT
jgi:hypothetical protein